MKMAMAQDNDKLHHCPLCWKGFTKAHNVKVHLRMHTGEKPFQCQYCPQSFTSSGNLNDHLRVHSTARLFKCKICGSKFKRNATLKRHYEMHAKYKSDQLSQGNVNIKKENTGEEVLQTEIIHQPIYISKYDKSSEIIISEQQDENLNSEIFHQPNILHLDEFQDPQAATIELFLPTLNGQEDQDNRYTVINPRTVKEEKLDNFYDATILELTEEVEDIEGVKVKVYSLPRNSAAFEPVAKGGDNLTKQVPDTLKIETVTDNGIVPKKPIVHNTLESDLSKRYGAYVTKVLRMIDSEEKQADLIKELNQAIGEFVIENR